MKNLSREQLLEKLNDLYIELEQYEDLEKDYTDLEYDMEHLEKEFSGGRIGRGAISLRIHS